MWYLIPLLAVPLLLIPLLRRGQEVRFTFKEFLVLEALMCLLLISGFFLARWGAVQDTEIWSGQIVNKHSGSEKCCHCSDVCSTCTDSDGHTYDCHCVEFCDHNQDYYWSLEVSTGDRLIIKDCEPRRSAVPAAWSAAYIGEPAAVEHRYTNYLLADPEAVLDKLDVPTAGRWPVAPEYPRVFNHYKVNRAINLKTRLPTAQWNNALMALNARIGARKQVNTIIVATRSKDPAYADKLASDWLLGKKNDLIFVFGVKPNAEATVRWVRVVSISETRRIEREAQNALLGKHLKDVEDVGGILEALIVARFQRTPMSNFKHLMSSATPGPIGTVLLYLLACLGSFFGTRFMVKRDIFN